MGEFLALSSALCFGVTHFVNGLLSRRVDAMTVALHAQVGGTVLALLLAATLTGGSASLADYCWGALSGVGTGVGVAFLYRAMAQGAMSVVVPVSDVGAVALPVLVGVTLLGEHLSAPVWVGMAAVPPALWLVSQTASGTAGERRKALSDGVPSALVAGVGIGLQFLAMAQVDGDSGLWPVVLSRVVSVVVIAGVLASYRAPGPCRRRRGRRPWRRAWPVRPRSCCTWRRPRTSSWPWPPCSRPSIPSSPSCSPCCSWGSA